MMAADPAVRRVWMVVGSSPPYILRSRRESNWEGGMRV